MNKLKAMLTVTALAGTLVGLSCSAFAASSTSQCESYLTMPSSSFNSSVQNPASAATIAAALNSCMTNNMCSEINGVSNCSSLLGQRAFLSNYYASIPASSGGNSSSYDANFQARSSAPTPTFTQTTSAATQPTTSSNTTTDSSNAPTVVPINPTPVHTNITSKLPKKKSSSINWF